MDKDLELALLKNRIQAVRNLFDGLQGLGPTSRREADKIGVLLGQVSEIGQKTIKRRRLQNE